MRTRTQIPILCRNRDPSPSLCNVTLSAQYNLYPSGLESESESVPESVSGNVNKPLQSNLF